MAGLEHIVSFLGVSWGKDEDDQSGFDSETQKQRSANAVRCSGDWPAKALCREAT